jgi:hypothetical protein
MSFYKTLLNTMESSAAHKTTTHAEGKVSIIQTKLGEGVEGETVNSDRDRSREHGTLIESEPVGMVVIGHWRLNYLGSLHLSLPLYLQLSQGHITFRTSSDNRRRGRRMELEGQTWDWPTLLGKVRNTQGSVQAKS